MCLMHTVLHAAAPRCKLGSCSWSWPTCVEDPLRRGSGEPPALGSPAVPPQAGSERRRRRRSWSRSCAPASSSSVCLGSDSGRALPSRRRGPRPLPPWAPAHPPDAASAGCSPSGAVAGLPCSALMMDASPVALNLPTCRKAGHQITRGLHRFHAYSDWLLANQNCAAQRRVLVVFITVTVQHGSSLSMLAPAGRPFVQQACSNTREQWYRSPDKERTAGFSQIMPTARVSCAAASLAASDSTRAVASPDAALSARSRPRASASSSCRQETPCILL